MADMETGLQYPVGVYPDEKSVIQTTNKITKDVLNQFKDGHLDVPVALATPFDKNNKKVTKELIEAQAAFIDEYNQLSAKGFSASAKELKNFVKLYDEYKRQIRNTGQTGSKQNLAFRDSGLNEVFQNYKKQMNTLSKDVAKSVKENDLKLSKTTKNLVDLPKTNNHKAQQRISSQERKRQEDIRLQEELNRGASRAKASSVGAPINLGVRSPIMDGAYIDKDSLQASDISPYRIVDESRQAKELRKIRAEERKSLKSKIDRDYEIGGEDNKIGLRGASRSQSGTEYELIKRALLTEIAKIQGGLVKGKPGTTSQKLIDQVFANLAYDEEQGVDPLKSITGIHNMLQKRYDTKGKIGITDGTPRGEGSNQEEANETLKEIYKILGQFIKARQSVVNDIQSIRDSLSGNYNKESLYSQELNRIMNSEQVQALKQALTPTNGLLTRSLAQNVRESTREGVADNAAGRASRTANEIASDTLSIVTNDANTGFNTDQLANDLIKTNSAGDTDIYDALQEIKDILQTIVTVGIGTGGKGPFGKIAKEQISGLPSDRVRDPKTGLFYKSSSTGDDETIKVRRRLLTEEEENQKYLSSQYKRLVNSIEEERDQIEKGEHPSQQRQFLEPSEIFTTQKGIFGQLRKVFKDILPQTEVDRIMSMNAEEQARMRAERIETYGLNRGRNLTDTGDIADVKRTKSLFGWIYKNDERNKELFQDVKLTPGFTGENAIDTTAIMGALNKVLSGSEMFKAQTGGTLRNIIGSFTGYIGMPSIEKSRAQAEGLNQVMANVRNEILGLIQDIQAKEATLMGMQERGTARFDRDGYITDDSSLAAKNTFTKLEEQKQVLASALAEVGMIDEVVDKTGGKVKDIVKNLGFVMPELMQNNTILQNINAGLDKNGKALKFQTRLAEILNYSYQLMSRHIGQILKNWLWMINPLNLIKKAFDDFASYDPKWQRTLNVIKYNLRDIIRPFMEWLAQSLVNIIGFLDIISMKIQEAFGYTPISLFDQKNADEMKKTYEEISDISAGFDELHDIGSTSSENDPENLLGEIYKPQLSQAWVDLANEIGDLFAGIITGDLGFGDVMKKILEIAWDGLQTLWDWFKNTEVGQWLINNWGNILGTILKIFLGWKLLKIAGQLLFNALFGKLTVGSITSIFSKAGGWITKALNLTSFGSGILQGFSNVLVNGGGLIKTLKYAFTYPGLITQMGGWGQMLGMALVQGLGVAIGVAGVMKGFDMNADNASYNLGLMEAGGNEEDKKSNFWGTALGGISGAVAGGMLIGGPIGAAVGAVAGILVTSLAPAFEQVAVSAKEANNEMQKIEYYEGQLQGATTTVDKFTELVNMSNTALQSQTDKVYSLGEEYGISKTRLDELIQAVQNGTYSTDLLTGSETNLAGSLDQLSWQYTNNTELTNELTKAKLKLQKAEIDLAIAEDMAAGNFEIAAARIEVAYASNVYTADEATKKMVQIAKEGSAEQATAMLQNLSPDLQKKFQEEYSTTEKNLDELTDLYFSYSEDEREYFLQNLTGEVQQEMRERINAIKREVEKAPWYLRLLDIGNDGKIFGISYIDIPGYATGTNYVRSDGLAYLHQGEAVIPKKYNQPYQPTSMSPEEVAYMNQMMNTMRSLDDTLKQGITVNGQFVQRGSDLVSVINRTKSQSGADLLSNVSYAR